MVDETARGNAWLEWACGDEFAPIVRRSFEAGYSLGQDDLIVAAVREKQAINLCSADVLKKMLPLVDKAVTALHSLGLQSTGSSWLDDLEDILEYADEFAGDAYSDDDGDYDDD